jgi:hypothetical protein
MSVQKLQAAFTTHISHRHFTPFRNILLGAGLAYAWSTDRAMHTPLIVIAPSVYAGYQGYKGRDKIKAYITDQPITLTSKPILV